METLILILAILVIIESINLISVYSYVKYLEDEVDRLNKSSTRFYEEYRKFFKKWSETNYEKENLKIQNEELMDNHIPRID